MRALLAIIVLVVPNSHFALEGHPHASDPRALVGTWKLVSWQVVIEGQPPQDVFGSHPKGYLVLTPEGRSIVLTTAEDRRAGASDADRAALHKSMLAYSGRYRIEGNDFITHVDVSWNEEWNGTDQRRHFRLDGDKLFIESAPGPSIIYHGKTDFRRIVWEREE
jgi:Lipocalin-like domain